MSKETENVEIPELWSIKDGLLCREIELKDYGQGVELVFKIAAIAADLNHHPDITLKYSQVVVSTISHDAGKITDRDIELALKINSEISS